MKAQFATIEALVALSITLSTILLTESLLNLSAFTFNHQNSELKLIAAVYDIESQITQNSTISTCINRSYNKTSCLKNFTVYYDALYGISKINVISNGTFTPNNNTEAFCTMHEGGSKICVQVG